MRRLVPSFASTCDRRWSFVPALVLAALAWPATAAAQSWRPDVERAAAWAGQRNGTVSFAIRTRGRLYGRGLDRQVPSASVLKAMLMTAYLRQASVRARALTDGDQALLRPMIRRSDNVTATRIRDLIGNGALVRLARRAGMTRFAVNPIWGLSLITARDQTRFFLDLERLLPERHRAYALRLLRTIVPSQRWGMARVIPDGWRLHFKGGWGSGTGAVDHQVGLLRRGPHRIAIAVLTTGSPSHAYGKATLEGVSRRLLAGLGLTGTVGPPESEMRRAPLGAPS
jgi:Beta-lactamase enzyme family